MIPVRTIETNLASVTAMSRRSRLAPLREWMER